MQPVLKKLVEQYVNDIDENNFEDIVYAALSEDVFPFVNDKSAILCPDKTEMADIVRLRVQSFKE